MAISFQGASILFQDTDKISFDTDCCCSSACSHCDSNKTPVLGQVQVTFTYIGAGTGIPEGSPDGCTGADVCDDWDNTTIVINEASSVCRNLNITSGELTCDNITNIDFNIEARNAGADVLYQVNQSKSGSREGQFDQQLAGNPRDCLSDFPITLTYNSSNSNNTVCDWSDVSAEASLIF